MLIIIKKWNLVLLVLIFVLSVFSLGVLTRCGITKPVVALPEKSNLIILDAGHGAPDGGASGNSGVLEKDLNLSITKYLQGYLEEIGLEVLMTRVDDNGIYNPESRTIREKKRSDLKNREKMIDESQARMFISIHMNTFTDSQYSGPQVFYSVNHPDSKRLAERIQKEMISDLAPPSERVIKPAGKEIYLLSKAKIPAVLVECGFLSNQREEALLLDEEYQKRVAWSICCAVKQYMAE